MGRPVVASRAGGTPDIVLDGETGWLVPPVDPDALAAALDRALALDGTARAALAARSRAYAAARFSLEQASVPDAGALWRAGRRRPPGLA